MGWAKLLERVVDIDTEHCPNCGSEVKIVAAILKQAGPAYARHSGAGTAASSRCV